LVRTADFDALVFQVGEPILRDTRGSVAGGFFGAIVVASSRGQDLDDEIRGAFDAFATVLRG
jgi:hypothetical protein